jgi:hypothetical protein
MKRKVVFTTYGTKEYAATLKRIGREAKSTGWFSSVRILGPADLPTAYKSHLDQFLDAPKGGGYWLWKPILIRENMRNLSQDDILVYADAGCHVNRHGDFSRYVELLNASPFGSLSFQMPFLEQFWTSPRVFEYFGIPENSEHRQSGQFVGGIQLFRKCRESDELIERVCKVVDEAPELFTDLPLTGLEPAGFGGCRHDQSIWSVAKKIVGTTAITDETWTENWESIRHVPIQARRIRTVRTFWQRISNKLHGFSSFMRFLNK